MACTKRVDEQLLQAAHAHIVVLLLGWSQVLTAEVWIDVRSGRVDRWRDERIRERCTAKIVIIHLLILLKGRHAIRPVPEIVASHVLPAACTTHNLTGRFAQLVKILIRVIICNVNLWEEMWTRISVFRIQLPRAYEDLLVLDIILLLQCFLVRFRDSKSCLSAYLGSNWLT